MDNSQKSVIRPSKASQNIHYSIREVTVLARSLQKQGKRVLYLNIGDPNVFDFDLVPEAQQAAINAIQNCKNGYAPSEGLPEAVCAIENDAKNRQHIQNIVGTYTGNGASECIDLAITALANPGENLLLPTPTYPLYQTITARLGIEARYYNLDEKNAWAPDTDHIQSLIDENTRGIVVINPNNPTGCIYNESTLRKIIEIAKKHNLLILNDEIYERLIIQPDQKHVSLASLDPDVSVITFNGLSKAFLGPGIRIGWGLLSGHDENLKDYYDAILRMTRARLCANHPFQYAIKPCLEGNQAHLPTTLEKIRRRRDVCIQRINQIPGLSVVSPWGSFYMFVRVEGVKNDALWCKQLLIEQGVVVVPGSGFQFHDPNAGYFRLVFLANEQTLSEAFDKIAQFMQDHKNSGEF